VSFNYRATPRHTPLGGIIGLFVVGVGLAIACGIWVAAPYVAAANDRMTSGVVTAWHAHYPVGARTAELNYTPSIRYSVAGDQYSITSAMEVEAATERAHPVGSKVTVNYDPSHPAAAEWAASGTDLAINFWGVVGLLLGLILICGGIASLVMNARYRRLQP
jgi:Protein of unknown function (DUF3592)